VEEVDGAVSATVPPAVQSKLAVVLLLATIAASANASVFSVTWSDDSGPGTLRDAILQANAHAGRDTIEIHVTVRPTSPLPVITDAADIIGTDNGTGIDGTNAGTSTDGLVISAAGSMISGIRIERFDGDGLVINADDVGLQSLYIDSNQNGVRLNGRHDVLYGSMFLNNRANGIWATNASYGAVIGGPDSAIPEAPPRSVLAHANGAAGLRIDGTAAETWGVATTHNGEGQIIAGSGNRVRSGTSNSNAGNGYIFMPGNAALDNGAMCNGKLAIDINGDGPTPNDDPDVDGVVNAPVLTSVVDAGDAVTISGTLTATPSSTFLITFFSATACFSSRFGDQSVTTDANGHASFHRTLSKTSFGVFCFAQASRFTGNVIDSSERSNLLPPTETEPLPNADLSIEITAPHTVVPDEDVVIGYRVTNHGPSATGPYNLLLAHAIGETPSGGSMPALASGESFTTERLIHVSGARGSTITETAVLVPSDQHPDPQPANNTATVTLPIVAPSSVPALTSWTLLALGLAITIASLLRLRP
jgi:hypothetical protein